MLITLQRILVIIGLLASTHLLAQEQANNYLYRIQTVRAAPAELEALIAAYRQLATVGHFADQRIQQPVLLRHSQGDQWDLMLLWPMQSFVDYYASESVSMRATEALKNKDILENIAAMTAFSEDHFMTGPDLQVLRKSLTENRFAHIEVFHAIAGKKSELIHQRIIENRYLERVKRKANEIFVTQAGGDADVMTIGLYPSLQAFAAPQVLSDEQRDVIAKNVGFKGLDDISYYLRSLISSHHDTLANVVDLMAVEAPSQSS